MALTNAMRDFIAGAVVGVSTPLFDSTHTYLAVGDSTVAFDATQINLQGANQVRKGMDPGYPTRVANTATYQATFGPADGNWAWNEWGVFNAAVGGTMQNRVVEYNGTKQSGQTWIYQVGITINLGV